METINDSSKSALNSEKSIDSTLTYVTSRLFYDKVYLNDNISELLQGLEDFCTECIPESDSVHRGNDRIYIVKAINNKNSKECYSKIAIFLEYSMVSHRYYVDFQASPSESAFLNMGYNSDVYRRNPCALSAFLCGKGSLEELIEWVRTATGLVCECNDHAVRLIGKFPRLIDECNERY